MTGRFFEPPVRCAHYVRKDRKGNAKECPFGPPGQPNLLFFAAFAAFAVQSFLNRFFILARYALEYYTF